MSYELKSIGQWSESAQHLDMIIRTIKEDLFPLKRKDLGGCTSYGAPFTISREFSCYVDYLGTLYTGWTEWGKSGERFVAYLRDVLGLVNNGYKQHAELIREMYRNGPVHEFDPKVVFNSQGDKCGWLASVGYPPYAHDFDTSYGIKIHHLEIVQHPTDPKKYYLPVFTPQLLDDLIASIEYFKKGVGDLKARVLCWNRAVAYLGQPVRFDGFRPNLAGSVN